MPDSSVPHENPDEGAIQRLLEGARRIAVVGLSPKPHRDSYRVARYLQERGYQIVPVYPREEQILGQRVYRRLQDIPGTVDLVDVFRRREELVPVVEDAAAAGAPVLWFQLGCVNEEAARLARVSGITLVMDRCLMVDHSLLLGRTWRR